MYLIQESGAIRTTCLIIILAFHLNTFEYLVSHEFSKDANIIDYGLSSRPKGVVGGGCVVIGSCGSCSILLLFITTGDDGKS